MDSTIQLFLLIESLSGQISSLFGVAVLLLYNAVKSYIHSCYYNFDASLKHILIEDPHFVVFGCHSDASRVNKPIWFTGCVHSGTRDHNNRLLRAEFKTFSRYVTCA